jgi:hypothetical protein
MKPNRTPAQKRNDRAAQRQCRRDVAAFKKFVAYNIRQLEAGRPIAIIATVVTNPCGFGTKTICRLVKGPPNPPSES